MKIAIIGKRRMPPAVHSDLFRFVSLLRDGGAVLVAEPKFARVLETGFPTTPTPQGTDLVISVGGDGTLLKAARWVGDLGIPILGVNSGRLGYLTDCSLQQAATPDTVARILGGELEVESRTALMVTASSQLPPDFCPFALNEVALLRDDSASMILIHADIDGHPLASYPADGLIISTPTGSTGYNLSVGGPLVAPSARCLVVAPVAAHALTMRPLVVADTSLLDLSIEARSPRFRLSLDGRSVTLPLDTFLSVGRAPFTVNIARTSHVDFAETLRNKLLWGIDPR